MEASPTATAAVRISAGTDDTWSSSRPPATSRIRRSRAGMPRVFLRDRENATTRLLTTSASGGPANGYSNNPAISADGTTVVFESAATDLRRQRACGLNDVGVYLMRRSSGERTATERVRRRRAARRPERVSHHQRQWPIHGLHVKGGPDLCRRPPACLREPPDRNRVADVYLRDTATNTTTRVSRSHTGRDYRRREL